MATPQSIDDDNDWFCQRRPPPSETASEPAEYYLDTVPTRHPNRIPGLRSARMICMELDLPQEDHSRAEKCAALIEASGKEYKFQDLEKAMTMGDYGNEIPRRPSSEMGHKCPQLDRLPVVAWTAEGAERDPAVFDSKGAEGGHGLCCSAAGSAPALNTTQVSSELWRTPPRSQQPKITRALPFSPPSPNVRSLPKLFSRYSYIINRFLRDQSMDQSAYGDDPFTAPGQQPPYRGQMFSYGNPGSPLGGPYIPPTVYGPQAPYLSPNQAMTSYGYTQGPWRMNPYQGGVMHHLVPPTPVNPHFPPQAMHGPPRPALSSQHHVYSTIESPASFISSMAPSQQTHMIQAYQQAYQHTPAAAQRQSPPMKVPESAKSIDTVAFPTEMPIGSLVHFQGPPTYGVMKIGNIPYSITKQEVIQFLGRQARILNGDQGCAVHIIMERSTAKTMDCYVEFQTSQDAQESVARINRVYEMGRPPRLGARHVEVEVSSQDALLKELFPRAKCVSWRDGMPHVLPNTDPYSTGFQGFFTGEEMVGMVRHAEVPQRSPFAAKCPQRTYECMISTLYKFPWHATKLYTVDDRNTLFQACDRQLKALVARVKRSNTIGLDHRLLHDLLYAGLNCSAFNERMKYSLSVHSENIHEMLKFPDCGKWFPFDTLIRMPGFDEPTLMYYANLISKGVVQEDPGTADLPNTFPTHGFQYDSPYGRLWLEWKKEIVKKKTWEDAVQHEMLVLTNLVLDGWIKTERDKGAVPPPPSPESQVGAGERTPNGNATANGAGSGLVNGHRTNPASLSGLGAVSSTTSAVRRPSEILSQSRVRSRNSARTNFNFPAFLTASGFLTHRNDMTMSSPSRLPPPLETHGQQGTGPGLAPPERDPRQAMGPYSG